MRIRAAGLRPLQSAYVGTMTGQDRRMTNNLTLIEAMRRIVLPVAITLAGLLLALHRLHHQTSSSTLSYSRLDPRIHTVERRVINASLREMTSRGWNPRTLVQTTGVEKRTTGFSKKRSSRSLAPSTDAPKLSPSLKRDIANKAPLQPARTMERNATTGPTSISFNASATPCPAFFTMLVELTTEKRIQISSLHCQP